MPFARKFEKGMGFPKVGQVVKGFTVESVSVRHISIQGGYYEYPTKIVVKGEGSADQVKKTFKEFYNDRRTLFSGYGNPYQCGHGNMDIRKVGVGRFLITSRGACMRIHLIPELMSFMAYLFNIRALSIDSDEDVWKEIIVEYMAEYEKSTLRVNPFFH